MASSNLNEATFNAILASSVHDMKNSLGMLLNALEEMAGEFDEADKDKFKKFSYLQHLAAGVNNDLMSLLSLYKIDHDQYPFNLREHDAVDFLEEQILRYSMIAERKGITLEVTSDEDFWWYFDEGLLAGVINDVVGNAVRYAKSAIRLSVAKDGDYLRISIEDDGEGYPESILTQEADVKKGISFESGSTGLGLFFTSIVAKMHTKDELTGYVKLDNDSSLGGGRYSIFLP